MHLKIECHFIAIASAAIIALVLLLSALYRPPKQCVFHTCNRRYQFFFFFFIVQQVPSNLILLSRLPEAHKPTVTIFHIVTQFQAHRMYVRRTSVLYIAMAGETMSRSIPSQKLIHLKFMMFKMRPVIHCTINYENIVQGSFSQPRKQPSSHHYRSTYSLFLVLFNTRIH